MTTTENAIATYKRTVLDCPRETWANWILAVNDSIIEGKWTGEAGLPRYDEEVFDAIQLAKKSISTGTGIYNS